MLSVFGDLGSALREFYLAETSQLIFHLLSRHGGFIKWVLFEKKLVGDYSCCPNISFLYDVI